MKTKFKPIHGALLVAILAVWGSVALQVFEAVSEADPDVALTSGPRRASTSAVDGENFKNDVRDLFRWGPASKDSIKRVQPKPVVIQPAWQPPAIKLLGIVMGREGRTALVELEDGTTVFLAQRDTLAGMTLTRIEAKTVYYVYQGGSGFWTIE